MPARAPTMPWWNDRWFACALVLAAALPLLWPTIPPLTDLPNHMGRYQIELHPTPSLARWFAFRWGLLGNLGVDLLIVPFGTLFGVELGTKLIVIAIPPLTVAGMMLIAREAHGRLPASAALAVPLAYGAPFQFGFVNFVLAMALALLAFALWLRLARARRIGLRAVLFLVIAPALWVVHAFGWGVLGLLVLAGAIGEARARRASWRATIGHAIANCLPLVPPVMLFLVGGGGVAAGASPKRAFDYATKLGYLLGALRDWNIAYDVAAAMVLIACVALGAVGRGFRMQPMLALAGGLLMACFLVIPDKLFGSGFAAMRMVPYALALLVLALVPDGDDRRQRRVAIAACLFAAMRLTTQTVHYVALDRIWAGQLAALDHVARGSRVFAMAQLPCEERWNEPRIRHLAAIAIVRRDAVVNGQWTEPGAQLLTLRPGAPRGYAEDGTQTIVPPGCPVATRHILVDAMQRLPRDAFDDVWLIDVDPATVPAVPGLRPVWTQPRGALYRVTR